MSALYPNLAPVTEHLQASLPAWTAISWVLLIVLILLAIWLIVVIWQRIAIASALKKAAHGFKDKFSNLSRAHSLGGLGHLSSGSPRVEELISSVANQF